MPWYDFSIGVCQAFSICGVLGVPQDHLQVQQLTRMIHRTWHIVILMAIINYTERIQIYFYLFI